MNYSTLPEVVPDTSPEALSRTEAYDRAGSDVRDQKYTVVQDAAPSYQSPDVSPVPVPYSAVSSTSPAPPYKPPLSDIHPNNYPASIGAGMGAGAGAGAGVGMVDWENSRGPQGSMMRADESSPPSTKGDARICGLKKKMFLIILAIVLIIIAVAIGGGVGGAATKNKAQKASQDAEAADQTANETANEATDQSSIPTATTDTPGSASSPPTTSAPSGTSTSASAKASPTTTSRESIFDLVYSFEAHSGTKYTGESTVVRGEPGFVDLPFNATSYKWDPKETDCCITFCQGKSKDVGWRCTQFEREVSTAPFDRLFIGCGKDATQEKSRCK